MKGKVLKQISVDHIFPNPENPRIIFRPEELDSLLVSIKKFGVQVPIAVYEDRKKYILIDGERRLRVSKKLNLKTIPAIVQPKPSVLENLILMFNIHALREQWDILTIALKIPVVIELFEKENNKTPNEVELSNETGLTRGVIRRCKLLIELPDRFKENILNELHKPKGKQRFTEDFFLEMEQALKTVDKRFPHLTNDIDVVRDNLIKKYGHKVIRNITDFRMMRKIATAPENVNFSSAKAEKALGEIFSDNETGIESVYVNSVGSLYQEKQFISSASNFLDYVENLDDEEKNDSDILEVLQKISHAIDKILNREE